MGAVDGASDGIIDGESLRNRDGASDGSKDGDSEPVASAYVGLKETWFVGPADGARERKWVGSALALAERVDGISLGVTLGVSVSTKDMLGDELPSMIIEGASDDSTGWKSDGGELRLPRLLYDGTSLASVVLGAALANDTKEGTSDRICVWSVGETIGVQVGTCFSSDSSHSP